jgi:aminoglycoside phosphotransferase family enzyme
VWLNRRLAAGVYLGVVPLAREPGGGLRLGGKGAAVEWAVKMRRLRGDRSLLWLIKHGELTKEHVSLLANALANFYFASPPESPVLDDVCARLRRRVDDSKLLNSRLPANVRQAARRICSAQAEYLNGARMVLNLRVCDGRVVDGHGDLRSEHVFLERQPAIIDCVEYSAARRKADALDDLCALTMECQRLGRGDVAEALVAAYRRRTGDECFAHLEAFYRSLHACARAVVAAADVDGASPGRHSLAEAASYLEQARRDCKVFA